MAPQFLRGRKNRVSSDGTVKIQARNFILVLAVSLSACGESLAPGTKTSGVTVLSGADVTDTVDAVVEAGAFVDYILPMSNERGHVLVFGADAEGSKNGTEANLRVTYKHPFSETLMGSIGVGMTYGDDKLAETYFGVTSTNDVAAFSGQRFDASGGIVSWNVPIILTYRMDQSWTFLGIVRYEQLQGDAADSPVVSQRGDKNQGVFGVGFSYLF